MDDSLKKKLAAYAAMVAAMNANIPKAEAQVIYTDVNPNADVEQLGWWNLDLNNDSIIDFRFRDIWTSEINSSSMPTEWSRLKLIFAENKNSVMLKQDTINPGRLESGELISENYNFNYGGVLFESTDDGSLFGNFYSGIHYVGLKLEKDSNIYYGWARLSISPFTVYDYAYNAKPNQPVLVGEWDISHINHIIDSIFISPNPATTIIKVGIPNVQLDEESFIEVYNLKGTLLLRRQIEFNEVEYKMNINMLADGLYILKVKTSSEVLVQKFVKQNHFR